MFSKISILPLSLIMLGDTALASASNYDDGQWITTFRAGGNLISQDTFSSQITGNAVDLGSVDASLAGIPATTTLYHLQFNDAFDAGPSFGIETGYMAQSNLEPFARLSYSQMQGRTGLIGQISSPALASPAMIEANFGDMDSWSLNLGTRYFLADTGTFRTFVAGYVGADRVDALHAQLGISGGQQAVEREEFLPQQTRFDAGVEGGMAWQISNQADLSLSLGAQYLDARRSQTNAFAPLGIDEVSFSDQRWSVPIDLGLNYRF
jgi:hypothetical protein